MGENKFSPRALYLSPRRDRGESQVKFEKKTLFKAINTTLQETEETTAEQSVTPLWPVSRSLGRRWRRSTVLVQLPFFAEFLEVTGLFNHWQEKYPLDYTSPNAPEVVDAWHLTT